MLLDLLLCHSPGLGLKLVKVTELGFAVVHIWCKLILDVLGAALQLVAARWMEEWISPWSPTPKALQRSLVTLPSRGNQKGSAPQAPQPPLC